MKIGILTLPFHNNYGGILQSYALCQCLINNGYFPEVIFLRRLIDFQKKSILAVSKDELKNNIKKLFNFRQYRILNSKQKEILFKGATSFINKHIPHTCKQYFTYEDILNDDELQHYDAYIVGSDQVWRPIFALPNMDVFFLSFINSSNRKLAYAASFGTDIIELNKEQQIKYGKLIEKFDAISVREEYAISLIKDIYKWNINPVTVCDPTCLLEKEVYLNIINESKIKSTKGGLFYYILDMDKEKLNIVNNISYYKHLNKFTIMSNFYQHYFDDYLPTIEEWLMHIYCADYIVTDSFHGCIFSILFNKPFIAYCNIFRGKSRFDSLLKKYGLLDRLVFNRDAVTDKLIDEPIDWDTVNDILKKEREKSLSFLLNNLKNTN